jgi:hypothetical protein
VSIDTTFHPLSETVVVDSTAAAQVKAGQRGATTFRLVMRSSGAAATAYVAYGAAAPAAPAAPVGVGVFGNVISLSVNVPIYLELPTNSFFISSAAFATSWIEITGGIGGVGG